MMRRKNDRTEPVELAQEFRVFDFASPWDQKVETNLLQTNVDSEESTEK